MFNIRSFGQIAFQLLGTGLWGLTVYIVGNIVIRPQTTNALLNIFKIMFYSSGVPTVEINFIII